MAITSRAALIDYCKRKLGEPVIEVNVDEDQVEDRIDDALQYYKDWHMDATVRTYLKHLVTEQNVIDGYIPISSDIIYISSLFPISSYNITGRGMFSVKYQIALNDMHNMTQFTGNLAYYKQMKQYMSLLDMELTGTPQVSFSRRQNRLYIWGDFVDQDIKAGDYVVAEVYQALNPESHTSIYDDKFIKAYATALIKQQWGANLIKFEGMQMPGGVTLNGRQIYDDANAEIDKLKEDMHLEAELPPDFFVG